MEHFTNCVGKWKCNLVFCGFLSSFLSDKIHTLNLGGRFSNPFITGFRCHRHDSPNRASGGGNSSTSSSRFDIAWNIYHYNRLCGGQERGLSSVKSRIRLTTAWTFFYLGETRWNYGVCMCLCACVREIWWENWQYCRSINYTVKKWTAHHQVDQLHENPIFLHRQVKQVNQNSCLPNFVLAVAQLSSSREMFV